MQEATQVKIKMVLVSWLTSSPQFKSKVLERNVQLVIGVGQ